MSEPETLLLIHGFAGTGRTWDGVVACLDRQRYTPLAPDMPGHGARWAVSPVTFDTCIDAALHDAPDRFALCGYSMGARIALALALTHPDRVSRLILVSGTAGIESETERATRQAADEALATQLAHEDDIDAFARRWRAQPLFENESDAVRRLALADHARNRPAGLAASLRGVGTGTMVPMWDRLADLPMPVIAIAGQRDQRYVALAERIAASVRDGRSLTLPGGHSLALESPAELAAALGGLAGADRSDR